MLAESDRPKAGELMRVARTRMRPRMSQTALGERIGLSKDQLGRIERCEVSPSVDEFVAVAIEAQSPWMFKELARIADNAGLRDYELSPGQMSFEGVLTDAVGAFADAA